MQQNKYKMKALKVTTYLFTITLFFLSCKNDEDNSLQDPANLIGIWKFESSTTNSIEDQYSFCEFLETITFTETTITTKSYDDPNGENGQNCMLL